MLSFTITEVQKIEPVFYDWGALKWVMNGEVAPGCEQSFGLVHILPGADKSSALAQRGGGARLRPVR